VDGVSPVAAGDVFRQDRADLVDAGVVSFASCPGNFIEFGSWERRQDWYSPCF